MELRKELEVQGATHQWVASFMSHNDVDAKTMLNAINAVALQLNEQIITDLLIAVQQEEFEKEAPQEQEVSENDEEGSS